MLTFLSITCTGLLSSCNGQSSVDCLHQSSCKLAHRNELAITGLLRFIAQGCRAAQGCESLSHRDVPKGVLSLELVRIPS